MHCAWLSDLELARGRDNHDPDFKAAITLELPAGAVAADFQVRLAVYDCDDGSKYTESDLLGEHVLSFAALAALPSTALTLSGKDGKPTDAMLLVRAAPAVAAAIPAPSSAAAGAKVEAKVEPKAEAKVGVAGVSVNVGVKTGAKADVKADAKVDVTAAAPAPSASKVQLSFAAR